MSKVRLYISGNEVDFGDGESLLLFTYAAGELDAPAVVQNSYSKEITLPPTERNAQVFGALWRADKVAGGADAFDALAREPFEIRNNAGELLESGYVKMASASKTEGYRLNLFGGLGAFLYGLMYNSNGSKKSLADLTWGETLDAGLSFNINKTIVQDAWDRLDNAYDPMPIASPYDIINFAPMHNGLPSEFDANKGLVPVGGAHGCPAVTGMSGKNGYALVTFGKEFDEWEVRDLRSYLQRPVFRIKALLSALESAANNGGYEFDWSAVSSLEDLKAWLTLPLLHTEELEEVNNILTLSWSPFSITRADLENGKISIATPAETLPVTGKLTFSVGVKMQFFHDNSPAQLFLDRYNNRLYIFFRLIGYDALNNPIAYGPIREVAGSNSPDASAAAQHLASITGRTREGYLTSSVFGRIVPNEIEMQIQSGVGGGLEYVDATHSKLDVVSLTLSGYNIDHIALAVETVVSKPNYSSFDITKRIWGGYPELINGGQTALSSIYSASWETIFAKVQSEGSTKVRTGAFISKNALLGGSASPAEILLSLVKTFGLVLAYDGLNKRVRLLNRGDFYTGDEVDINERIDRERAYMVEPNGITEKWLDFSLQPAQGGFAEYYRNKYGFEYGSKSVDTGIQFNVGTLKVLQDVGFIEAVTGLAYSRYYYLVEDSSVGSGILPAPYLDNNCKYTLWNAAGEAQEYDVKSLSNSASISTINDLGLAYPNGYDGDFRVLLAGKDGEQDGDGAGMLLWRDAMMSEYVHLTDDTQEMLNANNGTPCWIPCLDDAGSFRVPSFISVELSHSWGDVTRSLNMAAPVELAGADYYYREGRAVYDRRWRAYIADRYNENAHRVTCYVDWGGMRIGQAMLGKFYWFDGCWWVLDKIEDYCWDNPQPCKCTFVRVLDKTAYTNGQS